MEVWEDDEVTEEKAAVVSVEEKIADKKKSDKKKDTEKTSSGTSTDEEEKTNFWRESNSEFLAKKQDEQKRDTRTCYRYRRGNRDHGNPTDEDPFFNIDDLRDAIPDDEPYSVPGYQSPKHVSVHTENSDDGGYYDDRVDDDEDWGYINRGNDYRARGYEDEEFGYQNANYVGDDDYGRGNRRNDGGHQGGNRGGNQRDDRRDAGRSERRDEMKGGMREEMIEGITGE
ncbi:U1 small nuclear ribonucleoprotein 70 kDa-like [Helianthus annuus]|uniref:U1 small nuclear ribonucleoprotein 70 kDa-like n=1 Tax=Helianthus annuus TaxID=4232 RepID=UPI000B8FB1AD|nr:U1 small nuclear ribonucleoprotein 70 kDa-like [Helianthus annuus]